MSSRAIFCQQPFSVAAIEALVCSGTDRALNRVNALDFAAEAKLNEGCVIAAFLHAARVGLFDLSWNVLHCLHEKLVPRDHRWPMPHWRVPPVGRKKLVRQQPGKYGVARRAQVPRRSFDKLAAGETSLRRMELLGPASGVVANDCNYR